MGRVGSGVVGGICMPPGRASDGFCMLSTMEEEGDGSSTFYLLTQPSHRPCAVPLYVD